MEFLAICSHTDYNSEAAMGFLAICSHTDFTGESIHGVPGHLQRHQLHRSVHPCNWEAAMGFLAISSHTDCTRESPMGLLRVVQAVGYIPTAS